MVTHFDLLYPDVGELVDAHEETSGGMFRGIRQAIASARPNEGLLLEAHAPQDLYKNPDFCAA